MNTPKHISQPQSQSLLIVMIRGDKQVKGVFPVITSQLPVTAVTVPRGMLSWAALNQSSFNEASFLDTEAEG